MVRVGDYVSWYCGDDVPMGCCGQVIDLLGDHVIVREMSAYGCAGTWLYRDFVEILLVSKLTVYTPKCVVDNP
jgi:hypothetical protein